MVVRGGGELGSAAARLLFLAGFPVAVLERPAPLAVRRKVCFAEAVFSGSMILEGVPGRLVSPAELPAALRAHDAVPVVVDPEGKTIASLRPHALVDARMAKRNLGSMREQAPLVIGIGPGFSAGEDVHAVVETDRGPHMGRVIRQGPPRPDTSVPSPVLGVAEARVLRAPARGSFRGLVRIGERVQAGDAVGEVGGQVVIARTSGLVRGLLAAGVVVEAHTKVGDVDPRGEAADVCAVSDKGRAVAAGVLEAVLVGLRTAS